MNEVHLLPYSHKLKPAYLKITLTTAAHILNVIYRVYTVNMLQK